MAGCFERKVFCGSNGELNILWMLSSEDFFSGYSPLYSAQGLYFMYNITNLDVKLLENYNSRTMKQRA